MSSIFIGASVLSFFGGLLSLVVTTLHSLMDGYWVPAKLGTALNFLFGLDAYTVQGIPWPELQSIVLIILAQPLWASLFVLAVLTAFLSQVVAAPSRAQ